MTKYESPCLDHRWQIVDPMGAMLHTKQYQYALLPRNKRLESSTRLYISWSSRTRKICDNMKTIHVHGCHGPGRLNKAIDYWKHAISRTAAAFCGRRCSSWSRGTAGRRQLVSGGQGGALHHGNASAKFDWSKFARRTKSITNIRSRIGRG